MSEFLLLTTLQSSANRHRQPTPWHHCQLHFDNTGNHGRCLHTRVFLWCCGYREWFVGSCNLYSLLSHADDLHVAELFQICLYQKREPVFSDGTYLVLSLDLHSALYLAASLCNEQAGAGSSSSRAS